MTNSAPAKITVDAHALARPSFTALPPLALYVHIPWCLRKCPYCDFNSHEVHGDAPEAVYVDALLADLEFALPSIWGRKVVSIFIGGGTPSLFSAAAIDRLLGGIRARVPLLPDAEVTLEANPGTFERAEICRLLRCGRESAVAGRAELRCRAACGARPRPRCRRGAPRGGGGADDLRQRQPGRDVRVAAADGGEARDDVAAALAFMPPHLSFYHLTLEPNTLFHRYPPPLPDDDTAADIEDAVHAMLEGAGYQHYETSAFAKPGRQCAHNANYWRFGDYLGIGAGAHSKLSFADRIVRQLRWKQPKQYLERVGHGSRCRKRSKSRAATSDSSSC